MAKSESQKIGAAKSVARKISTPTYQKTLGTPMSKADKIIADQALKQQDLNAKAAEKNKSTFVGGKRTTPRNLGATKTTGPTGSKAKPKTTVKAENALAKAAKVTAKTGENVQTVRSRIKTDVAKTAMRAKMIETRNKKGKK